MPNRSTTIILICLLLSSAFFDSTILATNPSSETSHNDWPMFQHDPAHTGTTSNDAPKYSPTVVWSLGAKDQNLHGSPAVVNGIVYVSGTNLYAFNASTGETLWVVDNGGYSSPIVVNNIVYSGARGSAYDARTGTQLWNLASEGATSVIAETLKNDFYKKIKEKATAQAVKGQRMYPPQVQTQQYVAKQPLF